MNSKGKSKAFTGGAGLFVAFLLVTVYWPQIAGRSQQPAPVVMPAGNLSDSVAILEEQRRVNDSASRAIAGTTREMAGQLIRMVRKEPAGQHQPARRPDIHLPTLAIRYQGEVYEVDPEVYRGYWIVDIDKLQQDFARSDSLASRPALVDTIIEEADQQISTWQRVKAFLTKPFRKH